MKFAWIRFESTREECCKTLSDLREKSIINGFAVSKIIDSRNIKEGHWYFCQQENAKKWSRVNIMFIGETKEEILDKVKNERKKYKCSKYMETDTSFEENEMVLSHIVKKEVATKKQMASQKRAKNILKNIKNDSFTVEQFTDTTSVVDSPKCRIKDIKNVSVKLVKLNENQITDRSTSQKLQSMSQMKSCNENNQNERSPSRSPLRDASKQHHQNQRSPRWSPIVGSSSKSRCIEGSRPLKKSINYSPLSEKSPSLRSSLRDVSMEKDHPNENSSRRSFRCDQWSPSRSRTKYFSYNLRRQRTVSRSPLRDAEIERSPSRSLDPESPFQYRCGERSPSHSRMKPCSNNRRSERLVSKSPLYDQSYSVQNSNRHERSLQRSPLRDASSQSTGHSHQRSPSRSPTRDLLLQENDLNANEDSSSREVQRKSGRRITEKKNIFIVKCLQFYESSEYGISEKRKRYKYNDENQIYLGENVHVSPQSWELMQLHKPSIFLIELAIIIWGEKDFGNRAFDLTRPIPNIPGRSPVKLIENHLLRLTISLFDDFLRRNNYTSIERADYLLKSIYILRHKIRDLRALEKKQDNNTLKTCRQLRYNSKE